VSIYPTIEPFDQGALDVGDRNLIYWEICGNPGESRHWSSTAALTRDARRACADSSIRPRIGLCCSTSVDAAEVFRTRVTMRLILPPIRLTI